MLLLLVYVFSCLLFPSLAVILPTGPYNKTRNSTGLSTGLTTATRPRTTFSYNAGNLSTVYGSSHTNPTSASKPWYLEHGCVAYSNPDFNGNSVCQCDTGEVYPMNSIGTTPASLFPGVCYATAKPTATTAKHADPCPIWGPTNCPAASPGLNIPAIIEGAKERYEAEILSNCTNLQYHYGYPGPNAEQNGDKCNKVLPIAEHMKWWWSQNKEVCSGNDTGFANCFFDRAPSNHQYDATNCANLGGNWYCPKPNHIDFVGVNATLDFYVAWNVYNFAIWCQTYYNGIYHGGFLAGQQVWNMTDTFIKPEKATPKWVFILLYVLTFVTGMISPSGWGKALPGAGGSVAAAAESSIIPFTNIWKKLGEAPWEYVLRGVQQTPAFTQHMLPTATEDGVHALMSAADIEAKLGYFIDTIANTMQTLSEAVPNNLTAFLDWTQYGYYYSEPPDQQTMTDNLRSGLNTFVLSQMLENAGFIVAKRDNFDPKAEYLAHQDDFMLKEYLDCPDYDKWGMCNKWYHFPEQNTAYLIMQPDSSHDTKDYTENIKELFDLGITDPSYLFVGSELCAIGANSSQGSDVPGLTNLETPSSYVTSCLSNVQVCTWNVDSGDTEFTNKTTCGYNIPAHSGWSPTTDGQCNVFWPNGYLGWWLYHEDKIFCMSSGFKEKRDNESSVIESSMYKSSMY